MTLQDFEKLARKRFNICLNKMLGEKNMEYSRNNDKLHNFKVAGTIKNETPEKALWGMWVKQLVSVIDIIEDIEKDRPPLDVALVEEKITDCINYLVLLEGLIMEETG
jgi:hypothetical protein